MPTLQTRIFTGTDAAEATAQLDTALSDGSFPVIAWRASALWITHRVVIPGVMARSSYELHVTAWVQG